MKLTINWLKDHFQTNKTETEIINVFNKIGLEVESVEPYISPGLQIGFNSNKEFFYGFQLSAGMLINSKSSYIYSPSICYGYKKIFNSKLNEKYIDVQMMSLPDTRGNIDGYPIPIGLGIGINFSGDKTNTRIKGYSNSPIVNCYIDNNF